MRKAAVVWLVLISVVVVCVWCPAALAQADDDEAGQDEAAPEDLTPEMLAPAAMLGLMAVFWVFYLVFFGAMMLIALGSLAVSVLAIWDCAHRDFPERNTQAVWCILILLTRWLGALVYYFAVYRANDPPRTGG